MVYTVYYVLWDSLGAACMQHLTAAHADTPTEFFVF
jgi:hypothetical protein